MVSKILSLVVVLIYFIVMWANAGIESCVTLVVCVIPLALIWFADSLGECTGFIGHGFVDQESPGCLVALMGWIFLLFPVIVWLIQRMVKT